MKKLNVEKLDLSQDEKALLDRYGLDPGHLAKVSTDLFQAGHYKKSFQIANILVKAFPQNARGWEFCGVALMYIDVAVWKKGTP